MLIMYNNIIIYIYICCPDTYCRQAYSNYINMLIFLVEPVIESREKYICYATSCNRYRHQHTPSILKKFLS